MNINLKIYFNHLVCFFVFGSVLAYFPFRADQISQIDAFSFAYLAKETFARYSMFLIPCFALFMESRRKIDARIFSAFLIYLVYLSVLFGFNDVTGSVLANLFAALYFYVSVAKYFDYSKLKNVGYWALGAVLLNLLLMAFQYFYKDPIFSRDLTNFHGLNQVPVDERMVGFLQLKANNGVFGAFMISFIALVNPFLMILVLPILWFGQSSAAIMAFCISYSLILFIRIKQIFRIFCVIVLMFLGTSYILKMDMPKGQFQERFKVWHAATSFTLRTNPIFGFGIGKFKNANFQTKQGEGHQNLTWVWAHNEYIQVFFENGLIGLSIVIAFIVSQLKDFLKFKNDKDIQILFAGLSSVFMISIFHFPFHVGKFSMLCVFIMALFHGKVSELRRLETCQL